MIRCEECDKKLKGSGQVCHSCFRNARCLRCTARPKAIIGLCLECFGVWEEAKTAAWSAFLAGPQAPP